MELGQRPHAGFDEGIDSGDDAQRLPPARLVMFTGRACRPGRDEFEILGRDGIRCLWTAECEQALRAVRLARFDGLVVDAQALGQRSSMLLGRLRAAFDCPIVVIADGHDEVDEILTLELGADAYLARPVAPRRLRAHLGVLERLRHGTLAGRDSTAVPQTLARNDPAAPWRIDRVGNRLLGNGVDLALTEMQCALLQCLLDARGRIVPRARLAAAMPLGRDVRARSIDVYMHRLRKRLSDAQIRSATIETARSRGYRWQHCDVVPDLFAA
jgi:DNA-binding response OmpR family regulator